VAGCGSSGSAGDTTAAPSSTTAKAKPAPSEPAPSAARAKPAEGATAPSGSGSSAKPKPRPSIAAEEAAPGDHSIQEYGSEAGGSENEEVVAAMRSFFSAMAAPHYTEVCAGIGAAYRESLARLAKLKHTGSSCASLLGTLLTASAASEAKKAAGATVSRVRVKDGTAFVLFRPPGGKLSYFVMKEEDGAWKATSISVGSPLNP
jgi:hypothetical protein